MRNRTINLFGLLLCSIGLTAAGFLFAMEVCGGNSFGLEPVLIAGEPVQGNELSAGVQMQFMRPSQMEAAGR